MSNKRKLDETSANSEPSLKRHKNEESPEPDMIPVKFQNETRKYKKSELVSIEFCRVKLQRWSPNLDQDESKDQPQYFIDLSLFPCLTATIFTAIIHVQIIFNKSSNNNKNTMIYDAAKSLLFDNIKINDLSQFLEGCKILLVKEIFNKEIFKHYFDEHTPVIPITTLKQLQNAHKNDAFLTSILSTQLPLYNIMNNYIAQKKVYELYNKTGNIRFPYSGNATPNGEHAVRYAIEQIRFEQNREVMRFSDAKYYKPDRQDYQAFEYDQEMKRRAQREENEYYDGYYEQQYDEYEAYDEYGSYVYSGKHVDVDRNGRRYYIPDSDYNEFNYKYQQIVKQNLKQDINYGLCAAFDDMIQCGANLELFLKTFFNFMDVTFLGKDDPVDIKIAFDHDDDSGNVMDRSSFCFYALAYIAHRMFILYLQKNGPIVKFIQQKYVPKRIFHLFHKILDHDVTKKNNFWNSDQMKILIKQRLNDCSEYKTKFNSVNGIRFPESVFVPITNYVSDPEWIINDFALKLNNTHCRRAMHSILDHCMGRMDEINISESLNNIFQQYLGVKINKQ